MTPSRRIFCSCPEDFLLVVEVVEPQVERGDPLDHAGLDAPPLLGREDARVGVAVQYLAVEAAGVVAIQ